MNTSRMKNKNDVVQFNENHKWVGCLGIVNEVKSWGYMVGVPIPQGGTAYIRCTDSDLEYIGAAKLVESGADTDDDL